MILVFRCRMLLELFLDLYSWHYFVNILSRNPTCQAEQHMICDITLGNVQDKHNYIVATDDDTYLLMTTVVLRHASQQKNSEENTDHVLTAANRCIVRAQPILLRKLSNCAVAFSRMPDFGEHQLLTLLDKSTGCFHSLLYYLCWCICISQSICENQLFDANWQHCKETLLIFI